MDFFWTVEFFLEIQRALLQSSSRQAQPPIPTSSRNKSMAPNSFKLCFLSIPCLFLIISPSSFSESRPFSAESDVTTPLPEEKNGGFSNRYSKAGAENEMALVGHEDMRYGGSRDDKRGCKGEECRNVRKAAEELPKQTDVVCAVEC